MGPYLKPSVHPTLLMCDAGLYYQPGMGKYEGSMGPSQLHRLACGDCATSDSTLNATQVHGRNILCRVRRPRSSLVVWVNSIHVVTPSEVGKRKIR